MRKPKTYRAWLKHRGEMFELGSKAIVLTRMLKESGEAEILEKISQRLSFIITQGLLNNGTRLPPGLETFIEQDASMRAMGYGVVLESIQGHLPIEYLNLAYHAWQDASQEVEAWENKSLIDYLVHWWLQTKGQKRLHKRVELWLDELAPTWRE